MDVNTGHLIRLMQGEEPSKGYQPIPPELEQAAILKLKDSSEAYVSLTSGGKLSRWAVGQRKKEKNLRRKRRKKGRKLIQDFCN